MKIGFCYDKIQKNSNNINTNDLNAEYETEETIEKLREVLGKAGEVIDLPWHQNIFDDLKKYRPDVVFNITESRYTRNRESYIPNLCEILNIPCTGSDGLALGISLDKALTKHIASSLGVRNARFRKIAELKDLDGLELEYPLFIKPNNEGSSMGIRQQSLVTDREELVMGVEKLIEIYRESVIVEEFLPGREFTVAVMGNSEPDIFPVAEIIVEEETGERASFYSYEYKNIHNKRVVCPASVSDDIKREMVQNTIIIFKELGCRDLARADFKLDRKGKPCFIEINPLPGLSPFYSIYPVQAGAAGIKYEDLITGLLESALKRKEEVFKW